MPRIAQAFVKSCLHDLLGERIASIVMHGRPRASLRRSRGSVLAGLRQRWERQLRIGLNFGAGRHDQQSVCFADCNRSTDVSER